MDIDDLTYEHQIITQAKFRLNQESGGKIGGTVLLPKSILSMRIFAFLSHEGKKLNSVPRLSNLEKIIDDFTNSTLVQPTINEFINNLKNNLGKTTPDNVSMKDILDQVEFLILLSFMDESETFKFVDGTLIEDLIKNLETLGTNKEYLFLLKTYKDEYSRDTFPVMPMGNLVVEGLLQLKLNELLKLKGRDEEFYRKIKKRRLKFIKEVHDELDVFKDDSILRPSDNVIYEIVMAASVLVLLSYDRTISLNEIESGNYLDNEIKSGFTEAMIEEKIEKTRKDIITFHVPIKQLGEKFKVSMFWVILIYTIIWIIFSTLIYLSFFNNNYILGLMIGILIFYTGGLLIESYTKSAGKSNK